MLRSLMFFVFILVFRGIHTQDYTDLIRNHLEKTSKDFPVDSIAHYRNNYYSVAFNFHREEISSSYNECISSIDGVYPLDSLLINSNVGKVVGDFKIYIGELVPFKLSQAIISFYYAQKLKGLEIILEKDGSFLSNSKSTWSCKRVIIGGGHCGYSILKKYISIDENVDKLLGASSHEEFISIFNKFDEREEEYLIKIESQRNRARFSACEDMLDIEQRKRCSSNNLKKWVRENITEELGANSKSNYEGVAYLDLDENGSVTSVFFYPEIGHEKEMVMKKLLNMPLWIPKKVNGSYIKSRVTLYLHY